MSTTLLFGRPERVPPERLRIVRTHSLTSGSFVQYPIIIAASAAVPGRRGRRCGKVADCKALRDD